MDHSNDTFTSEFSEQLATHY